jgi:hypothetical protein
MYRDINGLLRGRSTSNPVAEVRAHIKNIDKAMVSLRGVQPIQLWRGVPSSTIQRRLNVGSLHEIKPGMEFRDEGFMSVSGSRQFAEGWGGVTLDIRVPPGTRARYLGGTEHIPGQGGSLSNLPHEYETLLERDVTMVVREVIHPPGGYGRVRIRVDAYHKRIKPS